jgi:hypothetical protein
MTEVAERTELITSGPAEALAGLLGVPAPELEAGQGLPLLWHWPADSFGRHRSRRVRAPAPRQISHVLTEASARPTGPTPPGLG